MGGAALSWSLLVGLLTGLVTALVSRPLLLMLPEPVDDDQGEGAGEKVAYAALATPGFAVGCGSTATAGALAAALIVPVALLPPWLVLASLGVLLAGIDLRSTWLPRSLSQLGWLLLAVAVAVGAVLGAGWVFAARSAAGAVIAAALYGGVWALSRGGFGFGDVRFAPLVGGAAAGLGWQCLLAALTLGALLGAAHGLARVALAKRGPFPYAPALLAGGFAALLLAQFWPST